MIKEEIDLINNELPSTVKLVAVSKFNPVGAIQQAYDAGQRIFGENRPQELAEKVQLLPNDIQWHFLGHLQTNKLKLVLPYVSLVQSVDSEKLLMEINNFAVAKGLKVNCLLEMFVASEETKQGFDKTELMSVVNMLSSNPLPGIELCGLMGMASFTKDTEQVRGEFTHLANAFNEIKGQYSLSFPNFKELSMGMSGDYKIAIECGSTMVRIGTRIFGARKL
ncbi:MAG: YggS family pyridoxal phosphate-dependent enzyme [Bacteroidales bacterium]